MTQRPRRAIALVSALVAVALCAARADAQDARTRRFGSVPKEVSREAIAVFNAATTRRVRGDFTLTEKDTVRGDLAVMNGRTQIAGVVMGQLVVINGDLTVAGTGRIDGALTVIGGSFDAPERPTIGGEIRVWSSRLHVRDDADTLVVDTDRELFPRWTRWTRDDPNGSNSQLFLTTAHTYNRTEGLPIYLGPRIRVRNGDTGVEAESFGIFRTSDQLQWKGENLGYRLRLEVRQGRHAGFFFGARAFDDVDAVERWQLTESEVGFSSFLVTRDYRDYFARHGAQGYLGLYGRANSELRFTFGHERWNSRRMHNVPSLFNSNVGWRVNPRVDEGLMTLYTVSGVVDTRNRPDDPRSGWLLRGEVERGSGTLDFIAPATIGVRSQAVGAASYSRALFDLRRYNRLGPSLQFNLRAVVGGVLGSDPLPLQRRFALTGIDALPGFDFRQMIGATDAGTCATGESIAYVGLGRPAQCERMVLLQAEWKGEFSFDLFGHSTFTKRRLLSDGIKAEGSWVLFTNSGRGWLVGSTLGTLRYPSGSIPSPSSWRTDVGGGLDFGNIGLYVAQAVSESGLKPNFYVRLGQRF